MPALMEKAESMNLSKRHPDVFSSALSLRDRLEAESKIVSSIQSAIKSKDKDALRAAMAKAAEVRAALCVSVSLLDVVYCFSVTAL